MLLDLILSKFEIFIFFSILSIVIAFILLFLLQIQNFKSNKDSIIKQSENLNNTNREIKEYLVAVGNLLENQKKELGIISEKLLFIQRELNRLGSIKGSEDTLNIAINMVREGKSRDQIITKTGLREDEVEAIYTYYKK